MAYKYYFIKFSWRTIYIATTLLNGFLSLLQILLIQGITFGLSPFVFALGDDIFADFIAGVQFLVSRCTRIDEFDSINEAHLIVIDC